jgi:HEAT repeat protein
VPQKHHVSKEDEKIMPRSLLIMSLVISHCLLCNPANAQKAEDFEKSATLSYMSLEETKGTITIDSKKEGISLTASNATLEEILQSFADQQKMTLKVYCDDPSLDSKRVSIKLTSPSMHELLTQFLKPHYSVSFQDQEGKPAEGENPVKEVDIYSKDCKKRDHPLRTFVNIQEHPLFNKNPKDITLQELSQILKEEGPSSRIRALNIIAIKNEKDGIPLIKEALKDRNPQVVLKALNCLKILGRKYDVKDATISICERIQETPYSEFLIALAQYNKECIWPVIDRFINMQDRKGQNVAARALALTKDKKAIGYLSKIASHDDLDNSRQAIWAIGKIDGPEGTGFLIKYLREESGQRQIFAAQAVNLLPKTERAKAEGEIEKIVKSPDVSDEMLFSLAQVSYMEPFKRILTDKKVETTVKVKALRSLAIAGTEKSVDVVGISINDSATDVRLEATDALADIATENTIPYLIRALGDKEPEIRKAAANGLSGFSPEESVLSALSTALDDPDEGVRRSAIDAFLQLGEPNDAMVSILKNASSKSTDPYVSEKALYILKLWGKDQ